MRQDGEETENDILARILSSNSSKQEKYRESESAPDGFRDSRSGVHFPEGFEIFRRFKGADVRAVASGGAWVLKSSGAAHGSLNALSRAIGAGIENAWMGWHYLKDGKRQPTSTLRTPDAVRRRPKAASPPASPAPRSEDAVWLDDVRQGLAAIEDGRGLLADIYKAVENVRRTAGRSWPVSSDAMIRRTLEEHASDSDGYTGGGDLFTMPYGKGAGFWALR